MVDTLSQRFAELAALEGRAEVRKALAGRYGHGFAMIVSSLSFGLSRPEIFLAS